MTTIKNHHRFIALCSYWRYCKPYHARLLFVVVLFTTANILIAVIPVFIGQLIQVLSETPINTARGWTFAWILVGLSTFHDLFWRGSEFAYRGMVNEMTYRYETHLFQAVVQKPYPYFVDKLSGKIGSYITMISREFRNLTGNVLFDGSGMIVSIIAVATILSSINWQTGCVFIAGLIGMLMVGRYTLGRNMRDEAAAADKDSSKNGVLYDAITNYPSIKAFATESQEIATIDHQQTTTFLANQKSFLSGILFWASMSFFVRHLIWPIIVLMNVWFFMNGQLSLGQLATLLSTVLIFSSTIWAGVWYVSQLGQQMARVDEAHLYLFGPAIDISMQQLPTAAPQQFTQTIAIRNLTFAYPDKPDKTVLHTISIEIPRGQKVGIVGRSGSGKTTLTKLLLGFYDTDDSVFQIDGRNVSNRDIAQLISFVPQDTALFHRSIYENIAYGSQDPSKQDVELAAKKAHAHEFVESLQDGYDTLIGERGVKLSGGQRQRIAIARAMLQKKPILILDEATSALDSESERRVQSALGQLWKNKTVIAIAHRLSTLRHMDRIIVMEDGRIVEDGTHAELLRANGTYAKLWKHQSGGFIDEDMS